MPTSNEISGQFTKLLAKLEEYFNQIVVSK